MSRKILIFTSWIILFELIGSLLGYLTQTNLTPWYAELNKSSLTPPGFVFSIVWSMLYALLAIIGCILANRRQHTPFKSIFFLFVLQMLMNWAWTPLFFSLHLILFSSLWLVGITIINGILIMKLLRHEKYIAYLLTPYFLWLIFATYLNIAIYMHN